MLAEKGVKQENLDRLSPNGALPVYVVDALSQNKLRALTRGGKWKDVCEGKTALPTFREDMAIPVRGDKKGFRRLDKMPNGNIELDLMICTQPYPRIVLKTEKLSGSMRAVLDRLLENSEQSSEGYRQRCFEVRQDRNDGKVWWLHVNYDFPAAAVQGNKKIVVGVDLGYGCPMYVALSNGLALLGGRHFEPLASVFGRCKLKYSRGAAVC